MRDNSCPFARNAPADASDKFLAPEFTPTLSHLSEIDCGHRCGDNGSGAKNSSRRSFGLSSLTYGISGVCKCVTRSVADAFVEVVAVVLCPDDCVEVDCSGVVDVLVRVGGAEGRDCQREEEDALRRMLTRDTGLAGVWVAWEAGTSAMGTAVGKRTGVTDAVVVVFRFEVLVAVVFAVKRILIPDSLVLMSFFLLMLSLWSPLPNELLVLSKWLIGPLPV